ncbi:unnamed protein product [Vitrella brassicaformis CCMP3155]|uniref:Enoyl reductase (ER) domain-containing protein n=2 Tax=Vitrella brassicaformis TaxID=1169539 RepID=A0A0G4EAF6_VITBC|nr:unnamed protein product [Vitrella brassicaformis CCMP3155]|eukprot:CEL92585.1 unnamed protein product [Vitrella brassicaformis CCMP3155]
MEAWVQTGYGGPEVLERRSFPRPSPGANQVLVKIKAAALNPIDIARRTGLVAAFINDTFPFVPGYDFSGTVVGVGRDVTKWQEGMDVYGYVHERGVCPQRYGTFAEYTAVNEAFIAEKPASLTHQECASLPTAVMTSLQVLDSLAIPPDARVLWTAGAGGIGTTAIQLMKHYIGVKHIATTASGEEKAQLLKQLGANIVVDYTKQKVTDVLSDYDFAVDATGDWDSCLAIAGSVLTIRGGINRPASVPFFTVRARGSDLYRVRELYERGVVRPVVDSVFPFDSLPEAFSRLETGRVTGKVVLRGRDE